MQTSDWFNPKETDTEEEKKHKEKCLEALGQLSQAFGKFSEEDMDNWKKPVKE